MGSVNCHGTRRESWIRIKDKLRLIKPLAVNSVARTGTNALNIWNLMLIHSSIGVDFRPQGATDTNGRLPRHVDPLLGKLGRNVRWCQFPLDLPGMAFLQPHGLTFRGVDFIGLYHWNYMSIGIWQGSPRALYVFTIPDSLHQF